MMSAAGSAGAGTLVAVREEVARAAGAAQAGAVRRHARGALVAAAGNVVYACCQWAVLVILAKLGTPDLLGQFSLGMALTAPVILFSGLNLRAVQVSDARDEYPFREYLVLRAVTTAAAVVTLMVVVAEVGYRGQVALVIAIVALAKGLDSITDVYLGRWQRAQRLDAVSAVYALNGLASSGGVFVLLRLTRSLPGSLVAFAGGSALALWAALRIDRAIPRRHGPRRLELSNIRQLALVALPLGPVMLMAALNANVPRYFVALHQGTHGLGIFAALSCFVVAGTTLIAAAGQSLTPAMAEDYQKGNVSAYLRSVAVFVLIATIFGAAGIVAVVLAGRPLLAFLYSEEYAAAAGVLPVVMTAAAVGYVASALGHALTAARRFSVQVPLLLAVLATTAGACTVLVPRYGLAGAAWAGAAGAAAQVAGSVFALWWSTRQAWVGGRRR
jgi:O-antigen/teichoic acid export membrane protein